MLTQQLRANNCLEIAKNEEETQQQQQQQQHGGNSSNASMSSNSTSTGFTINAVISSIAAITPTTPDLQNAQLKIAEHERKSEFGLAQLLSEHLRVVLELVSVSIERSSTPSMHVSE